jgi:hypothetical protein
MIGMHLPKKTAIIHESDHTTGIVAALRSPGEGLRLHAFGDVDVDANNATRLPFIIVGNETA